MQNVTEYVHGYGTPEQERLVEQADHWPRLSGAVLVGLGVRLAFERR